ncbi:proline racemase family protein [Sporosarcina limicola]|uniref:Proline racemase n=1 Tax=Sporosarcina limicola TaxID=34101 RepID=A0A927MGA0_9BACL|nr:proline racemase family protein [Sporosarcina limicola]MBE1553333.1 proline racemase [Sporosarcina limicola]
MNFEKMFSTIDTHVAGEAFRVVIQSSIVLQSGDVQSNHDELRYNFEDEKNLLLNEPRGHRGMHGCLVTSSNVANFRLLFFNHNNVNNFKYEGLLTTVTALIETGNIKRTANDVYKVETVNGIFEVKVLVENQEVTSVSIESGVCSIDSLNPEFVSVTVDDDRKYLLFNLPSSVPGIQLEYLAALTSWGSEKVEKLSNENIYFDGIVLIESSPSTPNKVRSMTFEKDGYILRSPGIDSTFAILTALLSVSNDYSEVENISVFESVLTANLLSGDAYRFSVETEAFVTGMHQFILDHEDPLRNGFLLA